MQIDLTKDLQPEPNKIPRPIPSRKKRLFFRIVIFLLALLFFFPLNIIFSGNGLLTNFGKLSFWEGVGRLIVGKEKILKGELFDRINVLILGMGGAEHEGPFLTDTIILASFKPSASQLGLLSIPRDLYAPIPDFGWRKINSANTYGMTKANDGGTLTSQVVSNVFDLPVHYWLRVDFNIFKDVIDELGGVGVNVERNFIDYQYPGANFSYRLVKFDAGWQTMDGTRALEFVRSRHGTNGEDSDFARSRRQQKILLAIKEKVNEKNLLSQPLFILKIYDIFQDNISSNFSLSESIKLAKLLGQVTEEKTVTKTLGADENGPLRVEIGLDGAYLLKPKTGNFKELAKIAQNIFEAPVTQEEKPPPEADPDRGRGTIIVLNGTFIQNLARDMSETLATIGWQVMQIGNAPTRDYKKTEIFAAESADKKLLNDLQKLTGGELVDEIPAELKSLFKNNQTDFIIILGKM